jgi:hypothetical protein
LIGAALGLMTAACSTHSHSSAPPGSRTGAAPASTITVTYAATSRSSPADQASIIYTNPTDGVEFVIQAPAEWSESWQMRANTSIVLRVEVVGPSPAADSCGIRINGRQINADAGQTSDDPDTPIICAYAWPAENA